MVNGTQMTLEMFMPGMFRKQTVGASERPVSRSQSPENEQEWMENPVSFEKYFAYCKKSGKKIDLNGCSMKMLRECFQATEDLTTLPFSLKWTGGGMTSHGRYSTLNITEYRKTGSVCLLSDILEVVVPQKYFLSKEQTERIVFSESDTGKGTDETRKSLTGGGITEALDTGAGGGRGHHTVEVIGKAYERDNYGDNRNRVVGVGGVSPSLTATQYKEPYRVGVSLSEILTLPGKG